MTKADEGMTPIQRCQLVSVNVGLPCLFCNGELVSTGIFKSRLPDVRLTLNLDGDRQSDLSVHGGPGRPSGYPSEHY